MLSQLRLDFEFDADRLQRDLALVRSDEWVAHFNKNDYDGGWSGVSLRSIGGAAKDILPGAKASLDSFADTPILERCSYFAEVLRHFRCPIRSARLLKLQPGSIIREHRDQDLGFKDGEVRIHVPIITNPDVAFFVNGDRLPMHPGEVWYIDFSLPHRVRNRGNTDRVHLVIDCIVDDWLRGVLAPVTAEPDVPPPETPRSPEALRRFRAVVEQDDALQEDLRDIMDRELFVSRLVKQGASRGCHFAEADVEEALQAERRVWLDRRLMK